MTTPYFIAWQLEEQARGPLYPLMGLTNKEDNGTTENMCLPEVARRSQLLIYDPEDPEVSTPHTHTYKTSLLPSTAPPTVEASVSLFRAA